MNFASGDLDFPYPDEAADAALAAAGNPTVPYTNVDGDPDLKAAIAADIEKRHGEGVSTDRIIVSTGSKQSIFNALFVTATPGAEVIVPAPYWSSHIDIAVLAGYNPIVPKLDAANAFSMSAEILEAAITPNTRWLILTNPSSPVGTVPDAAALRDVGQVLMRNPQVNVLCDHLYEAFVFDGAKHLSLSALCPGLTDRIVTVSGVSKSYAMMGWRIGWAAGSQEIIRSMATFQSQVTSSPSTIGQAAALAALQKAELHREFLVNRVAENRRMAIAELNRVPDMSVVPNLGSIYLFVDVSAFSQDDRAFSEALLAEAGLAVLPGGDCGMSPYIRVNIARNPAELHSGIERLARFASKARMN